MLSTGMVNDAFQQGAGRAPTGQELSQYTSDSSFDGGAGQQSLIAKLKGGSGGGLASPSNSGQTQQYLNDYHNLVLQATANAEKPIESDQQIMSDVKGALLPNTPIPQAPNMTQEFQSLRSDPSVTNLEDKLTSLKTQEAQIQTQTQMSQLSEEGKPVAENVINGRQTEEQRLADIQLNSISLQKSAITDELTMRYTMIDNIMKYTQSDYDNALKNYETQFAQNQAIWTAFNADKNTQIDQQQQALSTAVTATGNEADMSMKQDQFAYQQQQDIVKNASSNLSIMANMITSGNIKYGDLSSDQKLNIQKMEVQAGLGTGFLENLVSSNAGGKVIYAGANGAVLQMPDGSLKTDNYNVSGKSGGGVTKLSLEEQQSQDSGKIAQYLEGKANSYGNVTPAVWKQAVSAWQKDGYKTSDFINNFSNYTDPNRGDFTNSYGFNPKARGGVNSTTVSTKNATTTQLP